jgi:hypothetical protein
MPTRWNKDQNFLFIQLVKNTHTLTVLRASGEVKLYSLDTLASAPVGNIPSYSTHPYSNLQRAKTCMNPRLESSRMPWGSFLSWRLVVLYALES